MDLGRLFSMDANQATVEALEACLQALDEETDRLICLASSARDPDFQRQYWKLAADVQAEARKLRAEFRELASPARRSHFRSLFKWFGRSRPSATRFGRASSLIC